MSLTFEELFDEPNAQIEVSDKVGLFQLPASVRDSAVAELAMNFAKMWTKEQMDAKRHGWVPDSDFEISQCDDVWTVSNCNGQMIVIDADEGMFCQMDTSAITGKAKSVSVYVNWNFYARIAFDPDSIESDEPAHKKMKIVLIETGKGGRQAFAVPAECA